MKLPHVLVIPSWYPTEEMPVNGNFFREQTLAYKDLGGQIGVVFPEHRSIKGLRPSTFVRSHFQKFEEDDEGIPTFREKGWNLFPRLQLGGDFWTLSVKGLFGRYARKYGNPDIIHVHSVMWGGIAAASILRSLKIPFVITEHSSAFARKLLPPGQLALARSAFAKASRVLCVSSELQKLLKKEGVVSPEHVQVVPNMVDTGFFRLPATTKHTTPFRFLSISLLLKNKGFDVLLKAFAQAFKGDTNFILEIGGNGPERENLEDLAKDLGISSQVSFLGMLDKSQVREALWRSNALVHASHYETFGVILIEALSTGLPVIATACGGPQDIVCEGCGHLVPVKDPAALAVQMRAIVAETFSPEQLRDYAKEKFDRVVVANQLATIYSEVVEQYKFNLVR